MKDPEHPKYILKIDDETLRIWPYPDHVSQLSRTYYYNHRTDEYDMKGGWLESYENLSQEGKCKVLGNSVVYGNAKVFDDALVYNSRICGDSKVYGKAKVRESLIEDSEIYDNASVYGVTIKDRSKVYGNANVRDDVTIETEVEIFDNAEVYGHAQIEGGSKIYGSAKVLDGVYISDSEVYEEARVFDQAQVTSGSKIHGEAFVYGDVEVFGEEYSGIDRVKGLDFNIEEKENMMTAKEVMKDRILRYDINVKILAVTIPEIDDDYIVFFKEEKNYPNAADDDAAAFFHYNNKWYHADITSTVTYIDRKITTVVRIYSYDTETVQIRAEVFSDIKDTVDQENMDFFVQSIKEFIKKRC